ncbi:MAG TPA: hypothetical protein VKU94_03555 [Geobacterales bacterium]|nr:hypothetical protein [Geobacterales bacterium]
MKTELKELLKRVIKDGKIDKELINKFKSSNNITLEEIGYLNFIEGLSNYLNDNSNKMNKYSIYGLILSGRKDKLNELLFISFYDDDWIKGFKEAAKDALEIVAPDSQSMNNGSNKTKAHNPT